MQLSPGEDVTPVAQVVRAVGQTVSADTHHKTYGNTHARATLPPFEVSPSELHCLPYTVSINHSVTRNTDINFLKYDKGWQVSCSNTCTSRVCWYYATTHFHVLKMVLTSVWNFCRFSPPELSPLWMVVASCSSMICWESCERRGGGGGEGV